MEGFFEEFQAGNRAKRQEMIDEEISKVQKEDIIKATSAMIDANVDEAKIKELLVKYWDLRPSETTYFLDKAKA